MSRITVSTPTTATIISWTPLSGDIGADWVCTCATPERIRNPMCSVNPSPPPGIEPASASRKPTVTTSWASATRIGPIRSRRSPMPIPAIIAIITQQVGRKARSVVSGVIVKVANTMATPVATPSRSVLRSRPPGVLV